MSSPATSCSRRYTDNASTYCSRNRLITIASRNDLIPRFSVYQLGRGSDPVIVVGNTLPAVAFSIERRLLRPDRSGREMRRRPTRDPIRIDQFGDLVIWRFGIQQSRNRRIAAWRNPSSLSKPASSELLRMRGDSVAHEHCDGHGSDAAWHG